MIDMHWRWAMDVWLADVGRVHQTDRGAKTREVFFGYQPKIAYYVVRSQAQAEFNLFLIKLYVFNFLSRIIHSYLSARTAKNVIRKTVGWPPYCETRRYQYAWP